VDDGLLCNDTVLRRVNFDNLKLDLSHPTTNSEEISLTDGAIRFKEVGFEEDFKKRASETFNGIGNRKDGDTLGLVHRWMIS
jgi:hypothetical protein